MTEAVVSTNGNLSLTDVHPDAAVREVSAAELAEAIAAQYPRG